MNNILSMLLMVAASNQDVTKIELSTYPACKDVRSLILHNETKLAVTIKPKIDKQMYKSNNILSSYIIFPFYSVSMEVNYTPEMMYEKHVRFILTHESEDQTASQYIQGLFILKNLTDLDPIECLKELDNGTNK